MSTDRGDIGSLIKQLLEAHPGELPYLVHGEDVVGREQFRTAVDWEAEVLAGHGIGEGHKVMLQLPPSYTQVEVLLALWKLGAQVMLVDHRLKPAEVDTLRALCHPQYLLDTGSVGRSAIGFDPRYAVVTTRCPDGRGAVTDHRLVQFSSVSTGLPKVIGRTTASLAAEIERFGLIAGARRAAAAAQLDGAQLRPDRRAAALARLGHRRGVRAAADGGRHPGRRREQPGAGDLRHTVPLRAARHGPRGARAARAARGRLRRGDHAAGDRGPLLRALLGRGRRILWHRRIRRHRDGRERRA
jgi:hypothetical protein